MVQPIDNLEFRILQMKDVYEKAKELGVDNDVNIVRMFSVYKEIDTQIFGSYKRLIGTPQYEQSITMQTYRIAQQAYDTIKSKALYKEQFNR